MGNSYIKYNKEEPLGESKSEDQDSLLFNGTFQGQKVAVRRIKSASLATVDGTKEEILKKFDHPNIVKLIHYDNEDIYRCYAFEWCAASMDQRFLDEKDARQYRGRPLPSDYKVLLQLISGLRYIHAQDLVYGNIKPQNVLISDTTPVRMKWADFGLTKPVKVEGPFAVQQKESAYYAAPEIIRLWDAQFEAKTGAVVSGTVQSDIFGLGCLFFYYLTGGLHPYGNPEDILINILTSNPANFGGLRPNHFAKEIIEKMLDQKPENRTALGDISRQMTQKFKREFIGLCSSSDPSEEEISQLIRIVMDGDADVNGVDSEGNTPLLLLCHHNKSQSLYRCMEILLTSPNTENENKSAVNVNHQNKNGFNALLYLCKSSQHEKLKEVIQLLIKHGIDLNQTDTQRGMSALQLLCENYKQKNILELVQLLLDNGINVQHKDKAGFNALHDLCRNYPEDNLIDVARFLIEREIDVNAKTSKGSNVLHLLCRYYHRDNLIDIIRLIIEKSSIDTNEKDPDEWTAFLILCRYYHHSNLIDLIQLLIEKGANVNCKTPEGWIAFHVLQKYFPVKEQSDDIIKFLNAKSTEEKGTEVAPNSNDTEPITDEQKAEKTEDDDKMLYLNAFIYNRK